MVHIALRGFSIEGSLEELRMGRCRDEGGGGLHRADEHPINRLPGGRGGLGLDRFAWRQIQLNLRSAGFDLGGADSLFGPWTRAAIRSWWPALSPRFICRSPQIGDKRERGGCTGESSPIA